MHISRSRGLKGLLIGLWLIEAACEIEWKVGRSNFFGAPQDWKDWYPPGQFGDLFTNSCGFTDHEEGVKASNDLFALPTDAVGSLTDVLPDYVGGCGRCFEVKCKSGYILETMEKNMTMRSAYYLPRFGSKDLKDPEGRKWPGIPQGKDRELMWTSCRDEETSIVVTVVDTCPCTFRGGRRQKYCCGPIDHIGLSFWAFSKLAHPLYGMMMMQYRPVDCTTHQPLDERTTISSTIYRDQPGAGWAWNLYNRDTSTLIARGKGRNSSAATCAQLRPGGGLSFWCRKCHEPGFQPFDAHAISFWLKVHDSDGLPSSGGLPNIGLFLSRMHVPIYIRSGKVTPPEEFCDRKPNIKDYTTSKEGEWYHFQIPLHDFKCTGSIQLADANRIVFENQAIGEVADFCLDDIEILS